MGEMFVSSILSMASVIVISLSNWTLVQESDVSSYWNEAVATYQGPVTISASAGGVVVVSDPNGIRPTPTTVVGWAVSQEKGSEEADINWSQPLQTLGLSWVSEAVRLNNGPLVVSIGSGEILHFSIRKKSQSRHQRWHDPSEGTAIRNRVDWSQTGGYEFVSPNANG